MHRSIFLIIDEAENIPGVISGKVDMSDAPLSG
jgi:hypothetical protein